MKTKALIIAFLIMSLLGVFSLRINAQDTIYNTDGYFSKVTTYAASGDVKEVTELIADETWITYAKKGAKITCDNETVFGELFKTHGTIFKRFTCTWKTDRHGRYKHYVVYLAKEDAQLIVNWAKTNL